MLIIFPLCRKYKKSFTNIIAPVVSVLILGYLSYKYGNLSNGKVFDVFTFKCQLRAFAEISLGATAFAISEKLKTLKFSGFERMIITAVEAGCYLFAIYYSLGFEKAKYDFYALIALFFAIVISFSDLSFGGKLFNNKFVYFLGRLSLPIYLIQLFAKDLVIIIYPNIAQNKLAAIVSVFSLTLVLGVALLFISKPLEKKLTEKLERLNKSE